MTIDNKTKDVQTIDALIAEEKSSKPSLWQTVKDFDHGLDVGTGMGACFALWTTVVGLSFLGSQKARNYALQIHNENESRAEYIGAEIGQRIGMWSIAFIEAALVITTVPYSLGFLTVTNTAVYFYYKRKMKQREEEKRLQLPDK